MNNTITTLTKQGTATPLPYLYFADQGKQLLFIGIRQAAAPNNAHASGIASLLKLYAPTLVLTECTDWPIAASKADAFTVIALCNRNLVDQVVNALRKRERVFIIGDASRLPQVTQLLQNTGPDARSQSDPPSAKPSI
jgi:hypothetical protein